MTTQVLDESPSLGSLYLKAALSKSSSDPLPDTRLELRDVGLDLDHLHRYREICGFDGMTLVPATYPHVLAFPLHLALMTAPGFPLAVMGAVHVENTIRQARPIGLDETIDLAVWATDLRPHPRGRTVTVESETSVAGEVVWRGSSLFLSREEGADTAVRPPPADVPGEAPAGPIRWTLDAGLGRRYAAVSGDRNPIHLFGLTAKAFGFRTQIAHGMWTKARSLAALAPRLPDAFSVAVAFKKPVPLPSAVTFGARSSDGTIDFGMVSARTGKPHLLGRSTHRWDGSAS